MKALIIGAGGQLAIELEKSLPEGIEAVSLSIKDLDITDQEATLRRVVEEAPEVLINASGYTAVDKAEEEEEKATLVNGHGVRHLAQASKKCGAQFVHISTDFVFDGLSGTPYSSEAEPNPISAYGRSKLEGELATLEEVGDNATIVRTAWLYSSHSSNFLRNILKLLKENGQVQVVNDQIGTPTWSKTFATTLWKLHEADAKGIHHLTDSGEASWYEFAVAIRDLAVQHKLIDGAEVIPILTKEYPTPADRPAYSVLDCKETLMLIDYPMPHWRTNLSHCFDEIVKQNTFE